MPDGKGLGARLDGTGDPAVLRRWASLKAATDMR